MKVLITGAGGFLGSALVRAARAAGHDVLAMVRPAGGKVPDGVNTVRGDLRQPGAWTKALSDVDAIIHCAAGTSGDFASQLAASGLATENLLAAIGPSVKRFVHISTFSVYDFDAPRLGGTLDETTPFETRPLRRDAYTHAKLIQEQQVRDWAAAHAVACALIRPGAIYGPGKSWNFGRTMKLGGFDAIFAPLSRLRLVHVDNCAAAAVAALTASIEGIEAFNVVDDEQPSAWAYHARAKRAGARLGTRLPVPYVAVLSLGGLARLASKLFFSGKARLPEFLDGPRARAQWRPLRYSNAKARERLGWTPAVALDAGVADVVRSELPPQP